MKDIRLGTVSIDHAVNFVFSSRSSKLIFNCINTMIDFLFTFDDNQKNLPRARANMSYLINREDKEIELRHAIWKKLKDIIVFID